MSDKLHLWQKKGRGSGKRICEKDWTDTPLGPVENWPESLCNVLTVVIETRIPAIICWGSELTMIYNDAYQSLLGDKADALGKPFLGVWSEAEAYTGPMVEKARSGKSGYFKDMELPVSMNDKQGQFRYDIYYNPLRDEAGDIRGFLNILVEKAKHNLYRQDLLESKKRYKALFKGIDEGFCIIKVLFDEDNKPVDYIFLETNPAFEKQSGIKNANGKRRRNIEPQLEEYWYEFFGNVVLNQEPIRFQRPVTTSNRYYDVFAFPFGEAEEQKVAVIFRDISQRMEAERALQDSDKHLRLATKAADMHLCEVDLANETLKWTDEVEHNVGFPMPETLQEAEDLLHPEDETRVVAAFERVVKYHRDFEIEYRIIDPTNNKVIWVYSAGVAVTDSNNNHPRVVSVIKNITERKVADIREQFLMKLNNELQKIGDPDKIMSTTARMLGEHLNVDRCTYAKVGEDEDHLDILGNYTRDGMPNMESKTTMSAFGDTALELMHQNKSYVVNDVKRDKRIKTDNEAVYEHNQIKALICVPLHKDEKFVAKVAVHQREPRQWSPEEIELVKAVTNDCWEAVERARITHKLKAMNKTLEERVEKRTNALKTYQNQLRSLASELNRAEERERQRLASELHNNLGQLLAISKMGIDNLQKADLPKGIDSELADLSDLMDDALTFTRELMSDLKPPPALDKENITEILAWVAKKLKKHGLDVTIEGDNQPKHISEEIRTTLRRCVRELLFNVLKHAEVKEARVKISYDNKKLQVTVEDHGRGFSMESKEPTPTEEGGFGLFNIRERMRWLGGKFKIVSSPEKGTRATLYIPLKEKLPIDSSSEAEGRKDTFTVELERQRELWKKKEVLLVDDHEMMRKGLRKLIEEQKNLIIVAEASSGEEAVALAKQTSPDVIVMDVNLPDMDGIEATKKITFERPDISIIGLSLHDNEEVAKNMKNAGASSYLTKTEAFESLCATIREVVEGKNNSM